MTGADLPHDVRVGATGDPEVAQGLHILPACIESANELNARELLIKDDDQNR